MPIWQFSPSPLKHSLVQACIHSLPPPSHQYPPSSHQRSGNWSPPPPASRGRARSRQYGSAAPRPCRPAAARDWCMAASEPSCSPRRATRQGTRKARCAQFGYRGTARMQLQSVTNRSPCGPVTSQRVSYSWLPVWGYSLYAVTICYNHVVLSPVVVAVPDAIAVTGAGLAASWGGLPCDRLRTWGEGRGAGVGEAGRVQRASEAAQVPMCPCIPCAHVPM